MEKKQTLLLTVIAVATLLVAVVGATFAYFTAQGGNNANTQINVSTSTNAESSFDVDGSIVIAANQTNFSATDVSMFDDITGTVAYTSSNAATGDDLKYCYTVSFNIESNTFVENTEGYDDIPELLLNISKNSSEYTSTVGTLNRETVLASQNQDGADLTGYDITTATGNHAIGGIHEITTTAGHKGEDEWYTKVTLVNLNVDQKWNAGKTFLAKLQFTHDPDCTL